MNGNALIVLGLVAFWYFSTKKPPAPPAPAPLPEFMTQNELNQALIDWAKTVFLKRDVLLKVVSAITNQMSIDERKTLYRYIVKNDRSPETINKMNQIKANYSIFV